MGEGGRDICLITSENDEAMHARDIWVKGHGRNKEYTSELPSC